MVFVKTGDMPILNYLPCMHACMLLAFFFNSSFSFFSGYSCSLLSTDVIVETKPGILVNLHFLNLTKCFCVLT